MKEIPEQFQFEWNAVTANLMEIMRNVSRGNDCSSEGDVVGWYSRARIVEAMLRTRCVEKLGEETYNKYNFMNRFSEVSSLLLPRPGMTHDLAVKAQSLAEGSARMKMYDLWADLLRVGYDSEVLWPKKKVYDPIEEVRNDY